MCTWKLPNNKTANGTFYSFPATTGSTLNWTNMSSLSWWYLDCDCYLICRIDLSRLASTEVGGAVLKGDPDTGGWSGAGLCLVRRGELTSSGTLRLWIWGEWYWSRLELSPLHLWLEPDLLCLWRLKLSGTWGTDTSRLFLSWPGLW